MTSLKAWIPKLSHLSPEKVFNQPPCRLRLRVRSKCSHVQQQGWQALVSHTQLRPKLAQWCCICGTWCASNRAVKMHLARSHKEIWFKHRDRVERLCKSQRAIITSPCQLCGSVSKEPKAHVIACPVLFPSIFLHLLLGDDGVSGGQPLSTSSAHGQSADAGCDQQACKNGENSLQGQGDNAGQGSLSKWIRQPVPKEGHSATVAGDGQTDVATGRCASRHPSGLWLHLVCGDGATGHPAGYVWSECGVEAHQGANATSAEEATSRVDDGVHSAGTGSQNWLTDAGAWKYKTWDPAQKALVETGAAPLSTADLEATLADMQTLLQEPGVLRKFQASQPMETTTDHKEVCFTVQVALREDKAGLLHQGLTKLGDNMVLKLLRSRLRPERTQRHGLAKHVSDLLRQQ